MWVSQLFYPGSLLNKSHVSDRPATRHFSVGPHVHPSPIWQSRWPYCLTRCHMSQTWQRTALHQYGRCRSGRGRPEKGLREANSAGTVSRNRSRSAGAESIGRWVRGSADRGRPRHRRRALCVRDVQQVQCGWVGPFIAGRKVISHSACECRAETSN